MTTGGKEGRLSASCSLWKSWLLFHSFRLAGHAEPALRNDVLLDLARAAANDETQVVHVIDMPGRSRIVVAACAVIERIKREAGGAHDIDGQRRQAIAHFGAVKFHHETPKAGVSAFR